ncbi:DUF58 domain-containing protein [Alteribacter natronophilus]|uniref:DUF58 domain-containing protein n=1 Tax=Alteribacter natronophilus TaxID=2583810 RepID=UPI00110E0C85|nr:DUF58 domain-containing protein [Alteribacter natronophilus]TMW71089.1 DUF58 domain-containing protein [Alteribacter natronophilus]
MPAMRKSFQAVGKVLKVLAMIAVIAGTFSYAMFQGGFVPWFLFYTVSAIIVMMILYLAVPLGAFEVTRETGQQAAVAGSKLTVTVTIRRKWPFPFLYLNVRDDMEDSLRKQLDMSPEIIFYPTMKSELSFQYAIPSAKRGEYQFHGIHLETADMFGLYKKTKTVDAADKLLVYPSYHPIERWSAYERHDTETRLSASDFVQDVTSVAGSREYVPGDKLTSIDWKVSARANKLMTKEFEEYIGQNFLIALNGVVQDKKRETVEAFEKSIELVTSIIMYAHGRQLQYGLWTLSRDSSQFPLDGGTDQQRRLVYHLAKLKAETKGSFEARLKESEDRIPAGVSLILVTTRLTDAFLDRVNILLSRRVRVYVCLLAVGGGQDQWEKQRFHELKRQGAVAYVISDGSLDHAETTYKGERYETIS